MKSGVKDVTFHNDPEGVECENDGKNDIQPLPGLRSERLSYPPWIAPELLKFDRSAVSDERLDIAQKCHH